MNYKPGSFMIGENDLTVIVDKVIMIRFKNLSRAAIKSLTLSTKEYLAVDMISLDVTTPEQILRENNPTP